MIPPQCVNTWFSASRVLSVRAGRPRWKSAWVPSWLERDVAMTPDFDAEVVAFAAMWCPARGQGVIAAVGLPAPAARAQHVQVCRVTQQRDPGHHRPRHRVSGIAGAGEAGPGDRGKGKREQA